ncbi:gluconate 5-dehydrogenase, partial [Sinorhizobium meliloti]|nr:gluconate 5-dehydrogenase [Sinorhizobium meliloti]MQX60663.1 gluconate 5-dehydrogenase [Sinorhizobium meliloti]
MSTELFDLTGKRALVTGSSQGIGYALAKGLAAAGA